MKNVDELRGQLAEVFAKLRAGEIKPGEARRGRHEGYPCVAEMELL